MTLPVGAAPTTPTAPARGSTRATGPDDAFAALLQGAVAEQPGTEEQPTEDAVDGGTPAPPAPAALAPAWLLALLAAPVPAAAAVPAVVPSGTSPTGQSPVPVLPTVPGVATAVPPPGTPSTSAQAHTDPAEHLRGGAVTGEAPAAVLSIPTHSTGPVDGLARFRGNTPAAPVDPPTPSAPPVVTVSPPDAIAAGSPDPTLTSDPAIRTAPGTAIATAIATATAPPSAPAPATDATQTPRATEPAPAAAPAAAPTEVPGAEQPAGHAADSLSTSAVAGPPAAPTGATPTAAPPSPAPTPRADAPPVATQLTPQLLDLTSTQGTHTVTVVLAPESLGEVRVQLVVTGDEVQLTLVSGQDHGRAALADALPELRRDLAAAGLTVTTADVTGAPAGDPQTGSGWGGRPDGTDRWTSRVPTGVATADDDSDTTRTTGHTRDRSAAAGVDVRV